MAAASSSGGRAARRAPAPAAALPPRRQALQRLDALEIFVKVAELASFTAAADQLGVPKARVSTTVQQLERELGTRLLHRTTRKVQPTPDGEAFCERCKALLGDVDELQALFLGTPQALQGRVRIDMPVGVANNLVIPALPAFLAAHPQLEVELCSTDRRVDLVREGFDCVLRVGEVGDGSFVARRLGTLEQINCASPAYLKRHGRPRRLEDLAKHRIVHYAATPGTRPDGFEYHDGQAWRMWPMQGAVTVNNAQAYDAACRAGLGIIQAPAVGLRRWVRSGDLAEVLPRHRARPLPVSLLYAGPRHVSRRLQAVMAWIEQVLAPYLDEGAKRA
jgi:DNA-binding transcriptional LysR family regulator